MTADLPELLAQQMAGWHLVYRDVLTAFTVDHGGPAEGPPMLAATIDGKPQVYGLRCREALPDLVRHLRDQKPECLVFSSDAFARAWTEVTDVMDQAPVVREIGSLRERLNDGDMSVRDVVLTVGALPNGLGCLLISRYHHADDGSIIWDDDDQFFAAIPPNADVGSGIAADLALAWTEDP